MGIKLERGANISLTKLAPGINNFLIEINGDKNLSTQNAIEIDGSCFLLAENAKVVGNSGFIFYNQKHDGNYSVSLRDNEDRIEANDSFALFSVDLAKVTPDVDRIVFCLTIYNAEERRQDFSLLNRVGLRLFVNDTNEEIAHICCEQELDKETAILVGEFYRYNKEWKFKAIGQGFINGLKALTENFGVVLDDQQSNNFEDLENSNELVITKKKRRATTEVIANQIDLIKQKMKPLLSQIIASASNGINESSTRIVLDRIFQDVLGYTLEEIKTEQKIQGRAADYVLSPEGKDVIVIEAKRAGTPLRQRQIFQATSYAAYSGIQWAILTNLSEWQFYKVATIDKVDPQLVFTIDLQRGLDEENTYNLMLISKFGVLRKGLIDKTWLKTVCLRVETLMAAILHEEVINKIRGIIIKETGGQISNEEIKKAIETDILKI